MSGACAAARIRTTTGSTEYDAALVAIAAGANARDAASGGLDADVACLAGAGLLVAALPSALSGQTGWADDPIAMTGVLRAVGRASLSVGRLFEGHINAAALIGLYGSPQIRAATCTAVHRGTLLGVWGAEGREPVLAERTVDGFVLSGGKAFCSGLGIAATAVISAGLEGGSQLIAVDVADPARADPATWAVSGMRATVSGDYDFSGMKVAADAALGGIDDFFVEPYFLGGMYRFCAVQVGGLEALLAALIDHLRRRGHDDPVQQFRLGSAAAKLAMARTATEELARQVAVGEPARIATLAVLTRDGVEQCATGILAEVERAAGTSAHRDGSNLDRIRRDLNLYLRQAAVDARLVHAGAALIERGLAAAWD